MIPCLTQMLLSNVLTSNAITSGKGELTRNKRQTGLPCRIGIEAAREDIRAEQFSPPPP